MKVVYIEAQSKQEAEEHSKLEKLDLSMLPQTLYIVYSIQYKKLAEQLKEIIIKNNIKIKGFQQVLGCTELKLNCPILLIGSGLFHARNLALQNKTLFLYENGIIRRIEKKETEEIMKNKKMAILKFLNSNNIGIITSLKPGQENIQKALTIKERIQKKYKNKQVFIFLSNNINTAEFENFSIDLWLNTACKGLAYDSKIIINTDDILELL